MRISDWSSEVCSSDLPLASLRTPEGESSTVPSDTAQAPAVSTAPAAPLAPRKPQRHTLHGIAREDPYAWLRADNWREVLRDPAVLDPAIRDYLEAEHAYTEAVLAPTKALTLQLFEEMKPRIQEDASCVPHPHGPFDQSQTHEPGSQQPGASR